MISFENIKNVPKIDLHINFLSSVSESLLYSMDKDTNYDDMLSMNTLKLNDYDKCLELPVKLLNNERNVRKALRDLIERLSSSSVMYGEIYLDLPLYNKKIPAEYLVNIALDEIAKSNMQLKLALCACDTLEREENLDLIRIYHEYKDKGVAFIYFKKERITNLGDYIYLFDKMIREDVPYVLSYDNKINNQSRDIYEHAYRIIYELGYVEREIISLAKTNNIMLMFSISKLINTYSNFSVYELIDELIENNYLVSINSEDMTILNTDIINEYCLLVNNCDLKLLQIVKNTMTNIKSLNISDNQKEELITFLKEKSNSML